MQVGFGPLTDIRYLRLTLGSEDESGSHGRVDDFVAELITGEVVKPFSGAMTGNQVIRIDLLQRRDDLSDVVVVERRNDMKAADDGMHLLEAGRDLRLPDRIDNAAMATGGEDYQTFALDDEVGGDLVLEIVWNECASVLRR